MTPLIITFNEAPNIGRCLDRLKWAKRIVVVDSGSTDETLDIFTEYPQVDVLRRDFDDFARQCNFGLDQVRTQWVLSLDADYEISDELLGELKALNPSDHTAGFRVAFAYRVFGRRLRGSLYPARTVLYRKRAARYVQEGHGHRVSIDGEIEKLAGIIFHDDRKPLARWFSSQQAYASQEAAFLLTAPTSSLSRSDRVRRMGWPAPVLVFFYTLIVKRCIFDGWPGWAYALQRTLAEMLIAIELIDHRWRSALGQPDQ